MRSGSGIKSNLGHKNILIQQCPTPEEPDAWWVKLTDFGISKSLDLDAAAGAASTVIGTPEYMAPEVFSKQPGIAYLAADMWALGAMVFRMLTRTAVFSSIYEACHYTQSPNTLVLRPRLEKHDVSPVGQAFVSALLRSMPEQRPQSKAILLDDWVRPWIPSAAEPGPMVAYSE